MTQGVRAAFLSYCREDSEFALRLAGDLKAAGASVWLDQLDITPGQRWDRAVEDALTNCPRMMVILSPASINSTNVMDEVSFALEEQKTVIPVIYRDCTAPFRLRRVQHVDFRQDYACGLKVLLNILAPEQSADQRKPVVEDVTDELPRLDDERRKAVELEEDRNHAAEQARAEKERRRVTEEARLDDERRKSAEQGNHLQPERAPFFLQAGPVLIGSLSTGLVWAVLSVIYLYFWRVLQGHPFANWATLALEWCLQGLTFAIVLRYFRPNLSKIQLALIALIWPLIYGIINLVVRSMVSSHAALTALWVLGDALAGSLTGFLLAWPSGSKRWVGFWLGAVSFCLAGLLSGQIWRIVSPQEVGSAMYWTAAVATFAYTTLGATPLIWFARNHSNPAN